MRRGELPRALLMQVNIFLMITTLLIIKPSVNGLFLSEFGAAQLPYAFLLVAFAAALITTIYSRSVSRYSIHKIFIFTLVISILALAIFGTLLRFNIGTSIILYAFYIWVAIFALLTTSQFWIFANLLFDPREAKRIFGFIGAGAIAGGIFGGYLTSVLSPIIGSESLTFVAALTLVPTVFITNYIWHNYLKVKNEIVLSVNQSQFDTRHPFQIVKDTPHLRVVTSIVAVSVMVAKLVDYQFGGIAAELIPDPDELTAFFGFWFSTFSIISLGIQLFVTPKVVGNFGVGASLFILPMTILIAVFLVLIFPESLFVIVLLKLSDGGIKQSINKAAMELIIFPVPTLLKSKTKTFIDVFVDSIATGAIGILLILIVVFFNGSYQVVGLITVFMIAIWIYLVIKVKDEYLNTLTFNLKSAGPNKKADDIDLRSKSIIDGVNEVLASASDNQRLYMLDKIKLSPDSRFYSSLYQLLKASSPKIRSAALQNLYSYKERLDQEILNELIRDSDQSVKECAIEYLIRHAQDKRKVIQKYINHDHLKIRSAALVGMGREYRHTSDMATKILYKKYLKNAIGISQSCDNLEDRRLLEMAIIDSIGYGRINEFYSYVEERLGSDDEDILLHAIKSGGASQNEFFIEPLLLMAKTASNKARREEISSALSNYDITFLELFKQLEKSLQRNKLIRRFIPSVLKKIFRQSSVDYCFHLLSDVDPIVRSEAMRGLNTLRNDNPGILKFDDRLIAKKLKIAADEYLYIVGILYTQSEVLKGGSQEEQKARLALMNLLEKRIDRWLEIMFRLIGLKYPPENILPAYEGLKSEKIEIRNNAMEFLDNILDRDLKKMLLPLLEIAVDKSPDSELIKKLNIDLLKEEESYIYLLKNGDERVILTTLYLLKYRSEIKLSQELKALTTHNSVKVRDYARSLIEEYESGRS